MRLRKRKWVDGAPVHIYMRGQNGWVVFYRLEDFLVYSTILGVVCRKRNIKIISLCIMVNHVHILIQARNQAAMADFVKEINGMFASEYNREYGRSGRLFEHYGWAQKLVGKKLSSCIEYINNNPVVGHLSRSVSEYRWNFLAYHDNKFPFSQKVWKKRCSRALRRCMDTVESECSRGHYIGYSMLDFLFRNLSPAEAKLLSDYIISLYSPLDYHTLSKVYGSMACALNAFAHNAGDEFDLPDDWSDYSMYRCALRLSSDVLSSRGSYVENLDVQIRNRLIARMLSEYGLSKSIVAKFMHVRNL